MALSVFDLFTIGIGPSSSHTVGPMRAARRFAAALEREQKLASTAGLGVALLGSLGATGRGHGSDAAVVLGLEGETPEGVDPDAIAPRMARLRSERTLRILGQRSIAFSIDEHLRFDGERVLPMHPNGMLFAAYDPSGAALLERKYYSVGGGFVVGESSSPDDLAVPT